MCSVQRFISESSFKSYLIVLGGLRVFSVMPHDSGRIEIFRGHSVCYDDLLMCTDHPTVSSHRYGRQHVVTLPGTQEREGMGHGCSWFQPQISQHVPWAGLPVTIKVRMLACRNSRKTPAVSCFILFCMMIKPRNSMLVSIRALEITDHHLNTIHLSSALHKSWFKTLYRSRFKGISDGDKQ